MKILILASNPRKDLNLDREIRDLKEVVEKSRSGQEFEVEDALAVRVEDLQGLLLKHSPQIVHFCGHGSGQQGLVFEGSDGDEQWVRTEALSDLFRLLANQVNCVLLNACYSEEQANAIVNHIGYVIGMNQAIRDDAAIAFSKGFYQALGYNCTIEQAFEFGCNAIQLELSGSSQTRSATATSLRKAEILNQAQDITIPEHLKPILRINPVKSAAKVKSSETSLSQAERKRIELEIRASLAKAETPSADKAKSRGTIALICAGLLLLTASIIGINRLPFIVGELKTPPNQTTPIDSNTARDEASKIADEAEKMMASSELNTDILEQIIQKWNQAISKLETVSPSPEDNELVDYKNYLAYSQALHKGYQAAELSQESAGDYNSLSTWERVQGLWQEAIALLKTISENDTTLFKQAQYKIDEYETNKNTAALMASRASFRQAVDIANCLTDYKKTVQTKACHNEDPAEANSHDAWLSIASLWLRAADLMKETPQSCTCYQLAQEKRVEYSNYYNHALKQADKFL
ncbi:CHAT domain-containing protein [Nodosilinea nodulosa]|uniref:CHAT domain-containing protein n=1 Tax=Nodosilinea nodulosa TaxID=416001 RepID=UPI0002D63E27|nr:CHAT domain-containing protein [Nodosilinea nodulosa]